jgi:transcriptional regulator with XRE-family HTH domain
MNDGAKKLGVLLRPPPDQMSIAKLSRDYKISRQAIHEWLNGRQKPDYKNRARLRDGFSIPMESWDK